MSFSVNTNANALVAIQTLNQTNKSLSITQSRINSGFKVGGAKDNASTFAIAQGMRGDIAGFKAIKNSLALGESTVNIALKAAESISNVLNKIQGKVVEGQEENVDRAAIQRDIDDYLSQIDSIANGAQFNGVNLVNGTRATDLNVLSSMNRTSATATSPEYITVSAEDVTSAGLGVNGASVDVTGNYGKLAFDDALDVQSADTLTIGTADGQTYVFEFYEAGDTLATAQAANQTVIGVEIDTAAQSQQQRVAALASAMRDNGFTVNVDDDGTMSVFSNASDGGAPPTLGITSFTASFTGGTTATNPGTQPADALTSINDAITNMKGVLSRLGAASNRLELQGEFISDLSDSMEVGVGKLVDADLAAESAQLQALQTRQQLGLQALSIANQQPGAVLSLFR